MTETDNVARLPKLKRERYACPTCGGCNATLAGVDVYSGGNETPTVMPRFGGQLHSFSSTPLGVTFQIYCEDCLKTWMVEVTGPSWLEQCLGPNAERV